MKESIKQKVREAYFNKLSEMANVIISLVEYGEASPSDVLLNTSDYIDHSIIGNLYNSPIFQASLKKELCDNCSAIASVSNNDFEYDVNDPNIYK